jgi:hypothetical protein
MQCCAQRLPIKPLPGRVPGLSEPHDNGDEPDSRRPALIGLVLVLALVVVAYFLVNALRKNADLEDCLMSGRHNCGPVIEVPASGR